MGATDKIEEGAMEAISKSETYMQQSQYDHYYCGGGLGGELQVSWLTIICIRSLV